MYVEIRVQSSGALTRTTIPAHGVAHANHIAAVLAGAARRGGLTSLIRLPRRAMALQHGGLFAFVEIH